MNGYLMGIIALVALFFMGRQGHDGHQHINYSGCNRGDCNADVKWR